MSTTNVPTSSPSAAWLTLPAATAGNRSWNRAPNRRIAAAASLRRAIGVDPAWFCAPTTLTSQERYPAMAETTPIRFPVSSR